MRLQFEGEPSELRELLRQHPIFVGNVSDQLEARAGLEDWQTDLGGDKQLALAKLETDLVELRERRRFLEEEVAVLDARAAAARPISEAEAVIANAAELWKAVDAAMRQLTHTLDADGGPPATRDDVAVVEAELLRAVKALGDQLGEEGGEDLDPPC